MPKPSEKPPQPTVIHQDRVELRANDGVVLTATRNRTAKLTSVSISTDPEDVVTVSDATLLAFAATLVKLTKKKG